MQSFQFLRPIKPLVKSILSRLRPGYHFFKKSVLPWLDAGALIAWAVLLLKYRLTGQLQLLIHPNYFEFVSVTAIILLGMGGAKMWQVLQERISPVTTEDEVQHLTLFPPGVGTGLLIIVALLGLIIPPRVLASDTALQRGVTEALPFTQTQTQSFTQTIKPEERSLLDWVRTLNAYPEPDAYQGQPVKVTGFVIHPPDLPESYILISRFVITCCAVDAYPVGLPVKITENRSLYPADSWLEIKGEMMTETLKNERKMVIKANSLQPIPTPANPYKFR